jgi:hypothetical protein
MSKLDNDKGPPRIVGKMGKMRRMGGAARQQKLF